MKMHPDTAYEDLLISMLAINKHPLERVYPLREAMRSQSLFNLSDPGNLDPREVEKRFVAAGYDRRPYMNAILAERLNALADFAMTGGLTQLQDYLRAGEKDATSLLLAGLRGVGPAVLRNFWILQDGH